MMMDANQKQANENKPADKSKDNRPDQLLATTNNDQSTLNSQTKTNNIKHHQQQQSCPLTAKNNTHSHSTFIPNNLPTPNSSASKTANPSTKPIIKSSASPPIAADPNPVKTSLQTSKTTSKNNNYANDHGAEVASSKSTDNTDITTTQVTNGRHHSLSQEKQNNVNQPRPSKSGSTKPPASLNSSTYSSAGSSSSANSTSSTSSASSTTSSTSSSTSSSIFCSANQSHSSSAASSPGQNDLIGDTLVVVASLAEPLNKVKSTHHQVTLKGNVNGESDANIEKRNVHSHQLQPDNAKYEIARMEDLGKKAKIFEHRSIEYNANNNSTLKITDPSTTSSPSSNSVPTNSSQNSAAFNKNLTNNSTTNKSTLSDRIKILTLANDNDSKLLNLSALQKDPWTQQKAQDYSPSSDENLPTPTSTAAVLTSPGLTPASSWKTIAKRDKRKKKPAEKKIFAKEIPGNIGDRPVEELEIFIQSGTNSGPSNKNTIMNINTNNNDHKNSKNKLQQQTNNRAQQPQKSQSISNKPLHQQQIQQTNLSSNASQNQDLNQTTKLLQTPNLPSSSSQLSPNQQQFFANPKSSVVTKRMQSTTSQQQQSTPGTQQPDMPQSERSSKQQNSPVTTSQQVKNALSTVQPSEGSSQQAVVFAHHIKVVEETEQQYTFGFFDDRVEQKTSKNSKSANQNSQVNNQISNANNSPRKKANQNLQLENKQRQKQSQTSLSSERSYKFKDRVNVNSFNYDQILKFISNSWENSQSGKVAYKSGRVQ